MHHFYVKVCFEIYHAGEIDNVLVAILVHRGEQVEEDFPGGVDHCAVFPVLQMLLGGWLQQ